jgi:adenine-specific DNA-methyltransferase
MTGKSLTPNEILLSQLKELMPQAFNEGKLDKEKLLVSLGENIDISNERYVLNWAGKSDCFRVLQSPSSRTLVPAKEESINFDETENIFIEGENLEVLKILQKSYFGKIKMIYIDPPYNTGNDSFIYPDKFSEGKDEYLKRVGDKDEEGYMTKEGMFRKNSKENGQYHSNWLSMMYPRLFLARNLLRDDGVIFISIDDNEVHNLRLIMNEIFGEENSIGFITVVSNLKGRSDDKYFANAHNSLLVYKKNTFITNGVELPEDYWDDYPEIDELGRRYRLQGLRKRGAGARRIDRPNMFYPLYVKDSTGEVSISQMSGWIEVLPKLSDGEDGRWRWGLTTSESRISELCAKKVGAENRWDIFQIDYAENDEGVKRIKPKSIWTGSDFSNEVGNLEAKALLGKKIFETCKPTGLIKYCIEQTVDKDDIILDFFAGSASTAHALLDFNKENGRETKFICVQLPELCDENSEAFKSGYKTIADIGKERIRRVITKIKEEESGKLGFDDKKLDLGFKVLKLADSSFKQWRTDIKTEDDLKNQMKLFTDPTREGSTPLDMVYELILKSGKDINSSIVHKNNVYYINDTEMAILIEKVDGKTIDALIEKHPDKVIILDKLFKGNDSLKTNTALQMKDAGIEFKTI